MYGKEIIFKNEEKPLRACSGFCVAFLYQKPFLYVCCIVSIYAASMAVWVMSGLMISSYIPNSFVAICSPLILERRRY